MSPSVTTMTPKLYSISPSSGPALGGTLISTARTSRLQWRQSIQTQRDHRIGTMPLIVCRFGKPMWPIIRAASLFLHRATVSAVLITSRPTAHIPSCQTRCLQLIHNDTYALHLSAVCWWAADVIEVDLSEWSRFHGGQYALFNSIRRSACLLGTHPHTCPLITQPSLQLSLSHTHIPSLSSLRSSPPPLLSAGVAFSQYAAPAYQMDPTSSANSAAHLTYLMSGYGSASRGSRILYAVYPRKRRR